MRVSRIAERFQQRLARAGTVVTVKHPRTSYVGTGVELDALWPAFKLAALELADEPFEHGGERHVVEHELLQFEASAMDAYELMFERQFVYTEWGTSSASRSG